MFLLNIPKVERLTRSEIQKISNINRNTNSNIKKLSKLNPLQTKLTWFPIFILSLFPVSTPFELWHHIAVESSRKNLLGHFDKVEEVTEINRYHRHHAACILDAMHLGSKIATRCRVFRAEFLPGFRQRHFWKPKLLKRQIRIDLKDWLLHLQSFHHWRHTSFLCFWSYPKR